MEIAIGVLVLGVIIGLILFPIFIGGDGVSVLFMNGDIDDVRIYSPALTASEVLTLYNYSA